MQTDVRQALVCGRCPNRRVLCHLIVVGGRVVPGARTRREVRRPPEGLPDTWQVAAGEPLRRRCKRGHPWDIPQADLDGAYRRAVTAGRRDIIAGVDVG